MEFDEAVAYLEESGDRTSAKAHEAMKAVFEKTPPEREAELPDIYARLFRDLKADYYDEDGNPYYSTKTLADYFGLSVEELMELAEKGEAPLIGGGELKRPH